jgi:hypothetical protein
MLIASLYSGDPGSSGLMLSKNGALTSEMIYRERIDQMVTVGSTILLPNEMNAHYSNLSRAILKDIPFVHVGFLHATHVFDPSRVKIKSKFIHRHELLHDIFILK